jgi:membrane-associated phospholipid phosphatase
VAQPTQRANHTVADARRRTLVVIATGAALAVAMLYVLAVRTHWGQRLDATALEGRHVVHARAIRVARDLHRSISIASVVLLGGAITLVAVVRGRTRLAVGTGVILAGSLATTETLKHVLGRPALGVESPLRAIPSFPSGHTTIAMALAIGAMLVAPRRRRPVVALVGAAFASIVGCEVVVTASHRPSDAIGSAFVVMAWTAAVLVVVLRSDATATPRRRAPSRVTPLLALGGATLLAVAFVGVAVVAFAIRSGRLETVGVGRAFVAAAVAIVGTIVTCIAVLLIVLDDADVGRPASRTAAMA